MLEGVGRRSVLTDVRYVLNFASFYDDSDSVNADSESDSNFAGSKLLFGRLGLLAQTSQIYFTKVSNYLGYKS